MSIWNMLSLAQKSCLAFRLRAGLLACTIPRRPHGCPYGAGPMGAGRQSHKTQTQSLASHLPGCWNESRRIIVYSWHRRAIDQVVQLAHAN